MPSLYSYRLFISHAWKYGDDYNRITSMLDNAPCFHYMNYSAPKEKPLELSSPYARRSEIAQKITNKIAPAQVVIVLSGMYTNHSDWMKYEIEEAFRLGKPIIAVRPWGNTVMPAYVQSMATECVGWNVASIIDAIRRHVK